MPTSECKECTAKIVHVDELIICNGGCGNNFCLKCSNIKRADLKLLNENLNLKWFCNQCSLSDINTKFVEIKHCIEKQEQNKLKRSDVREIVEEAIMKKFQKIKDDIISELMIIIEKNIETKCQQLNDEIKKGFTTNNEKINEICTEKNRNDVSKPSYAQIAKSNVNKIIIKPKNKDNKNNKETKNALKNVIEPTDGLINKVKEINNGAIIVECSNNDAYEEVQKKVSENIGAEYEIEKMRENTKQKIIKVTGMSTKLSNERIIDCITKQNGILCKNKEFKIIKVFEDYYRREESFNVLIASDSETCKNLIENRMLKIEWDVCKVYEYTQIKRCFKCLGFNHKAADCIYKKACGKCAGMHDTKECNANLIRCVNCYDLVKKKVIDVDVNHYVYSKKCPAYLRISEKKKKNS